MKSFRIPEQEWAQAMFTRLKTMIANLKASIDGAGYISQETDPTVPSWAKAPNKPTYTASEVGAVATTDVANNLTTTAAGKVLDARQGKALKDMIPTKTSDITNDGDGTYNFATVGQIPTRTSQLTNNGNDGTSPFATLADISDNAHVVMVQLSHHNRQQAITVREMLTELEKIPIDQCGVFYADANCSGRMTNNVATYLCGIIHPHPTNFDDITPYIPSYYYIGYDWLSYTVYMGSFSIRYNTSTSEWEVRPVDLQKIDSDFVNLYQGASS